MFPRAHYFHVTIYRIHSGDEADFGYIRWEIFTPTSRRKLFASEYRRPENDEWAVQLNLSSPVKVWASPALKENHDVDTVVAVNP